MENGFNLIIELPKYANICDAETRSAIVARAQNIQHILFECQLKHNSINIFINNVKTPKNPYFPLNSHDILFNLLNEENILAIISLLDASSLAL